MLAASAMLVVIKCSKFICNSLKHLKFGIMGDSQVDEMFGTDSSEKQCSEVLPRMLVDDLDATASDIQMEPSHSSPAHGIGIPFSPTLSTQNNTLGSTPRTQKTSGQPGVSPGPGISPGAPASECDSPMEYAKPMQPEGCQTSQAFVDLMENIAVEEINGKYGGPTQFIEAIWSSLPIPTRNAFCHWLALN